MSDPVQPPADPFASPPSYTPADPASSGTGPTTGGPAPTGVPYLPPSSAAPTMAAAHASAPAGSPETTGWMPGAPEVPVATGGPAPRRRSRGRLVGAIVGVVAVLAAGTFAVVKISGNDTAGGASSPTEVGNQFVAALDNEDVLAVVDLLLPGERETFREPFLRFIDQLKRLEILDGTASADSIGGVDINVVSTDITETPTNVPDISDITITGTATVTVDGTAVPIGQLLIDEVFGGKRPELDSNTSSNEQSTDDSVTFAVVKRDGRWYLSTFYTAAEHARGSADIPTTGLAPAGADTPDGAVDGMVQALAKLDVSTAIQLLDPTEAEALQRYAPLFVQQAEDAVAKQDITWQLDQTSYTVSGSGDRRSVGIDGFRFSYTDPGSGETKSVTYANGCFTGDLLGDYDGCTLATDGGDVASKLDIGDPAAAQALADTVKAAFADYDSSGIAVHEVDGKWYVSPLRSYYNAFDDVLSALDAQELRGIVDAAKTYVNSIDLGNMFGGTLSGFSSDVGLGTDDGTPTADTVTAGTNP